MFTSRFLQLFRFFGGKLFRSAWKPFSLLCHLISNTLHPRQPRWAAKDFSKPNYGRVSESELVEEENLPGYQAEWYYPVRIGEVIASQYQVVRKLGFGRTSTVWLARDLKECRHVCLKICILSSVSESNNLQELAAYQRLKNGPKNHPGQRAIRALLDEFVITGPDGEHQCFVHPPLWGTIAEFLRLGPDVDRLFFPLLAYMLKKLFLALDYTQQCEVIHTDISPTNIMLAIEDPTALEEFEQDELERPSPRKEINGRFIYVSHAIGCPEKAKCFPVLCDFGHAVWGGQKHNTVAQPDLYRSPEVILEVPWSYEIDIWNIACMVWDLFEGTHLFNGIDKEHQTYRLRAHLAEMIALMGPPQPDFVAQGSQSSEFFSPEGEFIAGITVPPPNSLEDMETTLKDWALDDEERDLFLRFMSKMLQWDPKNRQTPKQLLQDEWIKKHYPN